MKTVRGFMIAAILAATPAGEVAAQQPRARESDLAVLEARLQEQRAAATIVAEVVRRWPERLAPRDEKG